MQIATVLFAVAAFVLALTCAATGIAGLTGRLPRNRWVGVRTASTLTSDEAFTLANRVAGPGLIGAGGVAALGGTLGIIGGGWIGLLFVLAGVVCAVTLAGIVSGLGIRAITALRQEDPAHDCGISGGCTNCSLKGVCTPESSSSSASPDSASSH